MFRFESVPYLSEYVCQIWLRSDGRECNAGMTIAKGRKLRHPATIATFFLERPPLGSLVVRLFTGDPIGISGVTYICVAIRSLVCFRNVLI